MTDIDSISLNNLNDVIVTSSSINATRWYGGRRFTLKVGTTSEDVVLIDLYKKAQELSQIASTAEDWTKLKSFIEQLQEAETNAAETYEKRDDYSFYKFSSWFHRLFGGAFLGSHSKRLSKLEKKVDGKLVKSLTALLQKNGLALKNLSDQLKNNPTVVSLAAKQNVKSLEHASPTLKADKDFMLKMAKDNIEALGFANDTLKADEDFMLEAMWHNIKAIAYASDTLKADQAFMLKAVKRDIKPLDDASDELKANPDFMLKILVQFGQSIFGTYEKAFTYMKDLFVHISDEFKADEDFMLEAIRLNHRAIQFSPLQKDENFVLKAIKLNHRVLEYVPELRKNKDFMLKALVQNENSLHFPQDKDDHSLDLPIHNGSRCKSTSTDMKALRNDREFMLKALEQNIKLISLTPLTRDEAFMLEVIKFAPKAVQYTLLLRNDEDFLLNAIRTNPKTLPFIPNHLKNDPRFQGNALDQFNEG